MYVQDVVTVCMYLCQWAVCISAGSHFQPFRNSECAYIPVPGGFEGLGGQGLCSKL